jgi:hypothetical protein
MLANPGCEQIAAEDRCGANPLALMHLAGNQSVMRKTGRVNGCLMT